MEAVAEAWGLSRTRREIDEALRAASFNLQRLEERRWHKERARRSRADPLVPDGNPVASPPRVDMGPAEPTAGDTAGEAAPVPPTGSGQGMEGRIEVVDATGEAAPVARRAGVGLAARRVLGRAMHHLSAAWRGPRAVLRDG